MTLCVSTLIASEFMPVSLLTPIASGLEVTEGQAGQAIAISGVFAFATSLFITSVFGSLNRRVLLLSLTALMMVSGLIVSVAPNFAVLMVGRALLGIVIGGFWSLSAAIVMRLLPEKDVPRGLALLNGGNALATTIAAPLGSFLGDIIGWRGAFFVVVPLAGITFAWQALTLPSMEAEQRASKSSALGFLRLPDARMGMLAVALLFMGQFALFTYIRPILENVTQVSISGLSLILLLMGVAGLAGTWLVGRAVAFSLSATLIVAPILMGAVAISLTVASSMPLPTAGLLALWGFVGTAVPVAWWTWLSRTMPDNAEAGGGLMVAVIQIAITGGASGGGILFDVMGYQATLIASAALLGASALVGMAASRRASAWFPVARLA
jgi:predicted MFS family arabinose efflux permease